MQITWIEQLVLRKYRTRESILCCSTGSRLTSYWLSPYTAALPAVGGANTRPPPATSKKPTYRYSPGEVLTHITIHNRLDRVGLTASGVVPMGPGPPKYFQEIKIFLFKKHFPQVCSRVPPTPTQSIRGGRDASPRIWSRGRIYKSPLLGPLFHYLVFFSGFLQNFLARLHSIKFLFHKLLPREATRSAVLPWHVVRLSVCLSVCDVEVS